ncbi:MAG: OmpA family protein [Bacteroidota bacterium]
MKCFYSIIFFLAFNASGFAQSGYDTIKVLFPINITELNITAKKKLDSIAIIAQGANMLIYGYADYLGNEPANMGLAQGRAKNVKDYLLIHKIKEQQILVCEGIGEVKRTLPKTTDGYPEDRRVAIFIKRASSTTEEKKGLAQKPKKGIQLSEIQTDGHLIPIEKKTATVKPDRPDNEHLLVGPRPVASTIKKAAQAKPPVKSRFEGLSGLKTNEVMRIETIHFQPTRHYITKESEPILQELLQTLQDFPNLAINIEGHVCCMQGEGDALDTDTHELKLSENRARFIYQYLIDKGITANRLGYIGHGKRRPIIAIEETEEDAQKNRRVEIRVVRN